MTIIDTYLQDIDSKQRSELERIRTITKNAVPTAEEKITYGMPTMTYKGKSLLHFAAFKDHMSLFPTSGPTEELTEKLKDYKTSKGTIQFTLEKTLPEALIREIINLRMRDIDAKS
ncbi:MAG: hypothetical protein QG658_382 [Patescibacteria group bacterium]|nr:hypothetical protein [Patescibacteria group bacterium]